VPLIDVSGVGALSRFLKRCEVLGVVAFFSELKPGARDVLRRIGALKFMEVEAVATYAEALERAGASAGASLTTSATEDACRREGHRERPSMKEIDRRQGMFGTIEIKERLADGARLYCVGESIQTMTLQDGTSLFGYVHAIKLLLADARDVLVLGGGGGSLATMLSRRGASVTVVDVDPQAEDLARRYFGLHPGVRWITTDARSYLAACGHQFDGIVFDTCNAEGFVTDLATIDVLVSALSVMCTNGALILNLPSNGAIDHAWQLASAMVDRGLNATLFRPLEGEEANELLHVRICGPTETISVGDLGQRPLEARTYLATLQPMTPRMARPVAVPLRSAR
jgi:SAM-dependent methyltransferase